MYQKRHRTTFNQYQLTILEEAFKENSYPSPSFREALASKTNLDSSRVQVWFQNRRAKHKKQLSQAIKYFTANNGHHHHIHNHNHNHNHHLSHHGHHQSLIEQGISAVGGQAATRTNQQKSNSNFYVVGRGATIFTSAHSNTPSLPANTPPPILPISLTSARNTNNLQSNDVPTFDIKLDSPTDHLEEQQRQQQLLLHRQHQNYYNNLHHHNLQQQQQTEQQPHINFTANHLNPLWG